MLREPAMAAYIHSMVNRPDIIQSPVFDQSEGAWMVCWPGQEARNAKELESADPHPEPEAQAPAAAVLRVQPEMAIQTSTGMMMGNHHQGLWQQQPAMARLA